MSVEKILECDFCHKKSDESSAMGWFLVNEPRHGLLWSTSVRQDRTTEGYGDFCSIECLIKSEACICSKPANLGQIHGEEAKPCPVHESRTDTMVIEIDLSNNPVDNYKGRTNPAFQPSQQ